MWQTTLFRRIYNAPRIATTLVQLLWSSVGHYVDFHRSLCERLKANENSQKAENSA